MWILYWIYDTLEEELQRHGELEAIEAISSLNLGRRDSIRRDLFLLESKASPDRACSIASEYVMRIRWCSRNQPLLLVAHAYVRYMGDLSGGQIVRKQLAKILDPKTLSFYHFEGDLGQIKAQFRNGMDSQALSLDSISSIVKEANMAFDLTAAIFLELKTPASSKANCWTLVIPLLISMAMLSIGACHTYFPQFFNSS